MDFTNVLNDLITQTYANVISWKNESPSNWCNVIFNYNFAYKVFSCDYEREGLSFTLLFVEKKTPDQHSEWEGIAEEYHPELIILKDKLQIGVIDEYNGSKDDLIRLATAIDSKNSALMEFLKLFMK